jgi:hypothetical protein
VTSAEHLVTYEFRGDTAEMLDISRDVLYVGSQFVDDTFNIVDPGNVRPQREFRLSAVDIARPT